MLALLVACEGGGGGAPGCDVECPVGTRRIESLATEVIVESVFSWSRDGACEVLCEAIQPCVAPNVPVVSGEPATFACQPVDGMSDIPLPSEVDTSFATSWHEIAAPIASTLPVSLAVVSAHDGDGDGRDDLFGANASELAWLRSNGDGTFSGTSAPMPEGWDALATGDVDGDGGIDVVYASRDDHLRWLRASGAGSWDPPAEIGVFTPVAYEGVGLWIEDLDGDGFGDVIVQNWSSSPNVAVVYGSPAGPVETVGVPISSNMDVLVSWGDVDGDGLLDLATSADRGTVLRQQGRGFAVLASGVWEEDVTVTAVALQDLDDDGLDDLWAALPVQAACDGGSCLRSWRSTGSALVEGGWSPWPSDLPAITTAADLDGDGVTERIGAAGATPVLVYGLGTGAPEWVTRISPVEAWVTTGGDFDGDGLGEVAAVLGADVALVFP